MNGEFGEIGFWKKRWEKLSRYMCRCRNQRRLRKAWKRVNHANSMLRNILNSDVGRRFLKIGTAIRESDNAGS